MSEWKVPVQSLIDHIKTAVDVDPWAKEMAEELLKEQDDVIPIKVVAEFLADNAMPPPTAERWEKVMVWEQFLLDLKGRKTWYDKSRSHSDFE